MKIGQLEGSLPSGAKQTPAVDIYHTATRTANKNSDLLCSQHLITAAAIIIIIKIIMPSAFDLVNCIFINTIRVCY